MALLERRILVRDAAVLQIAINEQSGTPDGAPESQTYRQIILPRGVARLNVGIGVKVHVMPSPRSHLRERIQYSQRGEELKEKAVAPTKEVSFVLFPFRRSVRAECDGGILLAVGLGLDHE